MHGGAAEAGAAAVIGLCVALVVCGGPAVAPTVQVLHAAGSGESHPFRAVGGR